MNYFEYRKIKMDKDSGYFIYDLYDLQFIPPKSSLTVYFTFIIPKQKEIFIKSEYNPIIKIDANHEINLN